MSAQTIRLPSFGSLFLGTLQFYWRRLFAIFLILVVPAGLLLLYSAILFRLIAIEQTYLAPGPFSLFSPGIFFLLMFFGIVVVVFQLWGGSALFYLIVADRDVGMMEAYRECFLKIGSYIWILLITGLALLGGFLFFVVPGIFLSVSLIFAPLVLFSDEEKGLAALAKSRDFVRGNWWGVFFRIAIGGFLVWGLFSLVGFGSFIYLGSFFARTILIFVSIFIVAPLVFIFLQRLYNSLREEKLKVMEEISSERSLVLTSLLGSLFMVTIPVLLIMGLLRAPQVLSFLSFRFDEVFSGDSPLFSAFGAEFSEVEDGVNRAYVRDRARYSAVGKLMPALTRLSEKDGFCPSNAQGRVYRSTLPFGGGLGWLPVTPLSPEGEELAPPRDPLNTSYYSYIFVCNGVGQYELNARFEDEEFIEKHAGDGGDNNALYEVGTNLNLIP